MARKSQKSSVIDGYQYRVRQFGATEGMQVLTSLTKILAPSAAHFVPGLGQDTEMSVDLLMSSNISTDVLSSAVERLAVNLTSESVADVVSRLATHTDIFGPGFGDQGAPLDTHYDDHFAGRYKALFSWILFALKVNFGSFLQGLGTDSGAAESDPQAPRGQA